MSFPISPALNPQPSNNVQTQELNAENILAELEKVDDGEQQPNKESEKPNQEARSKPDTTEEIDTETDENELEIELEEPPTELNQDEFVAPVSRKEILKEFPELFKKFPYLERAYYRDQQFTEVASTPEQAKELVAKAQEYDEIRASVGKGDITPVLEALKGTDKYEEFVDNFLGQLAKVDNNAYLHTVGNIYRAAIANLYIEGKESNDSDLMQAAEILNKQLFGNTRIIPPQALSRKADPKISEAEQRIQAREREIQQRELNRAYTDVSTRTDNALNAAVTQHIDPRDVMPPYVKKMAISEAIEKTKEAILADKPFVNQLNKLWEDAIKNDFNEISMNRLRTAYLSKARTILPNTIKNVRNEALKGLTTKSKVNKEEITGSRGPTGNKSRSAGSQETGQRNQIPKGVSTFDYLNSD